MARLSVRTGNLHASPVRDMLNVAMRPEVISFAGGLPAAETFAGLEVLSPLPPELLQYGPTEGEPALRTRISEELRGLGVDAPPERVLLLSGSQQGIDLAAKLVVDAGAALAVEEPAYLAALQVFRFFGAQFEVLDRADPSAGWDGGPPRLAYVTPTFQNPTGICWTAEQRQALARACDRHDVILFEDDPYRDLAYDDCERRPICAQVRRASWIYQGSFSKTVAPGLRLGFLAASPDLFAHLSRLKQAADLHANRLSQAIVLNYLDDPARPARLQRLVDGYRRRRDRFAASMRRHLGAHAEWDVPPGGLFFWATLKGGRSAEALLARALERDVLFTPGGHFAAVPGACAASLRLNFSHADETAADRGLAILGELLADTALAA